MRNCHSHLYASAWMNFSGLAAVKVKQSWTLGKGGKNRFYSVSIVVGRRSELSSNLHRGNWQNEGSSKRVMSGVSNRVREVKTTQKVGKRLGQCQCD